jgi:hypothetical protein
MHNGKNQKGFAQLSLVNLKARPDMKKRCIDFYQCIANQGLILLYGS